MANARLQNAMIPQDAVPLSDPGCGQAGFALFFPQTCVALVSGSAKDVLRLVANQLFPLLLRQLYPGAVTADIPLRDDRVEEVEDYIDRTSSRRVSGFLPILGGSASSPVLRLIAIQEDERTSRQCCDSFLEDLTSECGKVSTIPGLGTRGLRAVEKKLGRQHEPVAAFAANTTAASAAPAAAVTAKASSLALDDEDELYAMQEYEDEDDGYEDEDDLRRAARLPPPAEKGTEARPQTEQKTTRRGRPAAPALAACQGAFGCLYPHLCRLGWLPRLLLLEVGPEPRQLSDAARGVRQPHPDRSGRLPVRL